MITYPKILSSHDDLEAMVHGCLNEMMPIPDVIWVNEQFLLGLRERKTRKRFIYFSSAGPIGCILHQKYMDSPLFKAVNNEDN